MKAKSKKSAVELNELKGRIRAEGYTLRTLAPELSTTAATLSQKNNGISDYTATEIALLCDILNIPAEKIGIYFFPHMFPKETKAV